MSMDAQPMLRSYAELIINVGLNLQPGQPLIVLSPLEAAPLARLVAEEAYKKGSRLVTVWYGDEMLTLIRYQHAPRDSFAEFPDFTVAAVMEMVQKKGAYLAIYAEDPDLLAGQDPELIATAQKTAGEKLTPFRVEQMKNAVNWCVASYPVARWAARVFPNLPPSERETALADAILKTLRLQESDPMAAWKQHIAELAARAKYMTAKQYRALHLTGPGTDLTIGLPPGHIWQGGAVKALRGFDFVPNLPTEEIFTLPDAARTEGVVHATRPLSYAGTLIEDFSVTFKGGRAVDVQAPKNAEVLRNLVETDEGAARLGEIALVPAASAIARMPILFYNTLFDENAASHIALGRAYASTLQGGGDMTEEEFMKAGGNMSLVHVDFMIGSAQIDIDGVTQDGATEAVMRQGEWAYSV